MPAADRTIAAGENQTNPRSLARKPSGICRAVKYQRINRTKVGNRSKTTYRKRAQTAAFGAEKGLGDHYLKSRRPNLKGEYGGRIAGTCVDTYAGMAGRSIETGTDSVQSAVKYQSRQLLSRFFIIGRKIGKIRRK